MAVKIKENLKQPLLLFLALTAGIVIADQLIGSITNMLYHNNHWSWGSVGLYQSGLSFGPALNSLWEEIWFAETIVFIAMPLILWMLRKRLKTLFLPWILACLWMSFGLVIMLRDFENHARISGIAAPNVTYQLHSGAKIYPGRALEFDRSLQSELPYYLKAQVIPFALLGAGYVIANRLTFSPNYR